MLVHDKPKRRGPFAEHCSKGYVLGTDFLHYRAWTIWMKDTRATRISATTFHKHKYITNPSVTPEDRVMATAVKLAADLKGHMATHLSETSLHQLELLGTILKQGWAHPENPARPPPVPNKNPSTSPNSGPTEIPKETPIPYPELHPIPFYNHRPVYIADLGSIRKFPTRYPTTSPSSDPTQKFPRKPPWPGPIT